MRCVRFVGSLAAVWVRAARVWCEGSVRAALSWLYREGGTGAVTAVRASGVSAGCVSSAA